MDDASADLVLSLQLRDLNRLLDTPGKGKSCSTLSDSVVALSAYRGELINRLWILRDGRMGRSIAEAVRTDGGALARVTLQENGAINDRTMACEMGGTPGSFAPPPTPIIDLTNDADERIMGRFATINASLSRPIDLSPRPRLTLGQQLRQNQCSAIDTSSSTSVDTVLEEMCIL